MSAGMTVTPALAEEATPEAAAPAETVAVDAPTFYANSHDVKAVVMNIGAAQDSVNVVALQKNKKQIENRTEK